MRHDIELPGAIADRFRRRARKMALEPCELLDYLINREIDRLEKLEMMRLRYSLSRGIDP